MDGHSGRYEVLDKGVVKVAWTLGDGSELTLVANLREAPFEGVAVEAPLWLEGQSTASGLAGWSAVFTLAEANAQ